MGIETCGIILPEHGDDYLPECLLLKGHRERHLCKLWDGRYRLFWFSVDCGCEDLDCDCYDYLDIEEAEATELLNAQLKGKTI